MDPYTQAQWKQILRNATHALLSDPNDVRAQSAVDAARIALHGLNQQRDIETQRLNRQEEQAARNPGVLGSLGLGLSQGVTFGLGDELAGLVQGAGALLPGGKSPAEAYREQVGETRQATQGARENNPLAYYGGEIAGTLAVPLPGASAASRGLIPVGKSVLARGLSRVGRGALAGGIIGGVEGASRAEGGPRARLQGGLLGAVPGVAVGGLLPVAGAVASEVSRPVRSLIGRIGKRMGGETEGLLFREPKAKIVPKPKPINHWSSAQPPSKVGTSSPPRLPTQRELAERQLVLLRQLAESGDPEAMAAIQALFGQ